VESPGNRSSGTTDVECGRSVVATAGVDPGTPAKNEGDGVGLAVALLDYWLQHSSPFNDTDGRPSWVANRPTEAVKRNHYTFLPDSFGRAPLV
jgi:hypothetical protein